MPAPDGKRLIAAVQSAVSFATIRLVNVPLGVLTQSKSSGTKIWDGGASPISVAGSLPPAMMARASAPFGLVFEWTQPSGR
jgi:hypothetical protein